MENVSDPLIRLSLSKKILNLFYQALLLSMRLVMKLNVQILTSNPCYIMDLFLPTPLQKGRFQQDHCRPEKFFCMLMGFLLSTVVGVGWGVEAELWVLV